MKVAILFVVFFASTYAQIYVPSCSSKQVGYLWPYYEDYHYYYSCANVGVSFRLKCSKDTVFNFYRQSCGDVSSYDPPPSPENLPETPNGYPSTSAPTTTPPTTKSSTTGEPSTESPTTTAPATTSSIDLPTPQTPSSSTPTSSTPAPVVTEAPPETTVPVETPSPESSSTEAPITTTPIAPETPIIPQPPSPAPTDGPMPPTPAPTPPEIEIGPPSPAAFVLKKRFLQ